MQTQWIKDHDPRFTAAVYLFCFTRRISEPDEVPHLELLLARRGQVALPLLQERHPVVGEVVAALELRGSCSAAASE